MRRIKKSTPKWTPKPLTLNPAIAQGAQRLAAIRAEMEENARILHEGMQALRALQAERFERENLEEELRSIEAQEARHRAR